MTIDKILGFVELLNQYRDVERMVFVKGKERSENDAEHSYDLAMLAWYISSTYNLNLDQVKIYKYALAHDLVEIYAGDTWAFNTDMSKHTGKHDREREAAKKIHAEFPEFNDLHEIIKSYEERVDPESKFIYALDKIEPVIKIYLDKGRNWKKQSITLNKIKENKIPKVAADPTIESIFKSLITYMEAGEKDLFPQE